MEHRVKNKSRGTTKKVLRAPLQGPKEKCAKTNAEMITLIEMITPGDRIHLEFLGNERPDLSERITEILTLSKHHRIIPRKDGSHPLTGMIAIEQLSRVALSIVAQNRMWGHSMHTYEITAMENFDPLTFITHTVDRDMLKSITVIPSPRK